MDTARGVAFTTLHFFITYELSQYAKVFYYTRLESLARSKHFSSLGSFECYEEKEVF
jgi:hypothetical protein